MSIKKHIPNAITCCNLLCGCLAIIKISQGDLIAASYLVGAALVFDFFDGFAARLLKVSSAIGKDLDSLADMVTFGVVPGMMMFKMLSATFFIHAMQHALFAGLPELKTYGGQNLLASVKQYQTLSGIYAKTAEDVFSSPYFLLPLIAMIIPLLSCIRLAKFNNDTRQADSFIGLPTPANAMIICSLPLIAAFQPGQQAVMALIANPWFLSVLSVVMSLLLVFGPPLFALKFKSFGWAENKLRFVFLALSVLLILGFGFLGLPLVIILYILLSIVDNIFLKNKV